MTSDIGGGIFPADFDDEFPLGPGEGNRAFFGRDVLRGLVEGIEEFVAGRQPRWEHFRSLGPGLLGSAMWMDDPALLQALESLTRVCIVVRKEQQSHRVIPVLRDMAQRLPGIPTRAFPALSELAPKVDGKPLVVGPYETVEPEVPSVRSVGFRVAGAWPPIVHAKLALLGHFWWHDEGPDGHIEDIVSFSAKRLWISSANFTRGSRRSLEFGYWTEEPALLEGAQRFLLRLIAASEPIDAAADALDPELAMVVYDDEAMAEYAAEMGLESGEDE